MVPKHLLPYGVTCKTFAKPMMESCSLRHHFKLIGSWDGLSRWRYRWREWCWLDRREKDVGWIVDQQAVRHLFDYWFLLSHEKHFGVGKLVSCVDWSSRIIGFITCIELEKETGRIVLVAMVVASLAALSASSYLECQNGQGFIEWKWKTR